MKLALAALALALMPVASHAEADLSTYRAFGEKPGLVSLMDAFMVNLLADGRTRPFFEHADQTRIEAQAASESEKLKADAAEKRYDVDAEGQRKINEASNVLSAEQIAMQIRLAVLRHLPEIIRESVKPMAQIDGIKIVHVDGLTGGGAAAAAAGGDGASAVPGTGNLAEQVVASALRYRAQAPLIDSLMKDVGLSGGDLAGLVGGSALAGAGSDDDWRRRKLEELAAKRDGEGKPKNS